MIVAIGNAAAIGIKTVSSLTLYARRERTFVSCTLEKHENFLRLKGHQDVQLYHDAACTRPVIRFSWNSPNKPKSRHSYILCDNVRCNLIWLPHLTSAK